ncbi:MAG TPA: PHB depolymerase family esterase [Caulobacteraceae bacterium]|jgi:poly(hydroxyalkanoate) depolymerase family esterase|nr:PHB depolymerase family esterase [Caulobacteraceae bacterium]
MAGLEQTVAALARMKELARRAGAEPPHPPRRMTERHGFGANPGALRMLVYAPKGLPEGSPLVVTLHGCGQGAEAYAAGAGWLALADRLGFVVVAPEQSAANNANRCFNWFEPDDVAPGYGEAASIRQMVDAAVGDCDLDPSRVYVTGLSAGGAMTTALLAAYPEVFAAGAVLAGLPYRAADDVMAAFGAMFQPQARPARELGDLVRGASGYAGPWPRLSIWHGDADSTVSVLNEGEIAKQWVNVHGLAYAAAAHDHVDGQRHLVWSDAEGRPQVESYTIKGMGHGTPLATRGPDALGTAGPFLLEAGISSTERIADFWGLDRPAAAPALTEAPPIVLPAPAPRSAAPKPAVPEPATAAAAKPRARRPPRAAAPAAEPPVPPPVHRPPSAPDARRAAVHDVIAKALTAAGLMKR